jgi:hypothetical protein
MLQTAGITATAGIPVVSSVSATETVDIPILESPDGVEKWETVPRAWDEHRKHTRRVRQRVTDFLKLYDSINTKCGMKE